MICLLKLQEQLAFAAASAVFALTAASTMALAATSALTLRAASALPEGFFNLDEMLERMSEFSRDRFWLRRDDSMMAWGIEGGGATRMLALWNFWIASYLPVWLISLTKQAFKAWWYTVVARISRMSEFNSNLGGGGATNAMPRIRYLSAHANITDTYCRVARAVIR